MASAGLETSNDNDAMQGRVKRIILRVTNFAPARFESAVPREPALEFSAAAVFPYP
jgi:hypothetical protein